MGLFNSKHRLLLSMPFRDCPRIKLVKGKGGLEALAENVDVDEGAG